MAKWRGIRDGGATGVRRNPIGRAPRRDQGAGALEYVGGVLIGAMVLTGVLAALGGSAGPIGETAKCGVDKILSLGQGDCGAPGGSGTAQNAAGTEPSPSPGSSPEPPAAEGPGSSDPANPDRRDAGRDARGDRRDDARGRRGGQDDEQEPAGTEGDSPALGLGDPVPGESVDWPDPPAWQPPDEGAGEHGSEGAGLGDRAVEFAAETGAHALAGTWPHASRNLLHFLGNSGDTLQQDVNAMLDDVPAFADQTESDMRVLGDEAVAQAKASGATGPVTFPISTKWSGFYFTKDLSGDWFYALGGISYSHVGQITVYPPETPGGQWRYVADTRTVIRDQYNWDGGKGVTIGPLEVTDEELAKLHRAGLAQEYTAVGQSDRRRVEGAVP